MSHKEILGLHRITKKHLKELCKKHRLYQTPHLNDQLYLHYQGFQAIENLEEYTGLKCLWLESNAISEIQGLESLTELKCLFLQNNLISKIENLQCCPELDTLNLASNHITRIENCGVDVLPVLSTLNLSRNYLRNSGGLQELVNCKSLWSLDLANNRIDDILVVKIFANMPELRVLVLQGNPVVSQVPQYRKTLILECKNLTYLDSRPVFPKDRACAEAWKRGGYEEERKEHDRWIRMDRKKIRDSVNATLRLRQKHGDADVHLLESTDEEDETGQIKKKRKAILDKTTPDLEITGVDQSEESDRSPSTSNEISETTSAAMAESSTSLQAAGNFNSNEEEADDTLPDLIQSDDMPAEKEDPKVSKTPEGFEEPQNESMEALSDEKTVKVEEKDATDTKLQSEEGSVEKLEDDGEKSIQPPTDEVLIEQEEVSPSEPAPVESPNEDDSIEASTEVLQDTDAKPTKLDDDVEMEPDQDLTVSQDNERVDSSGSEPNLQEVVQACIAKSSLYNPVLMNSGPAFSKEPAAWKRFNSSDSSSGSDISSSSDLSSDESDTSDVSEDVTISDKDTNIAEPKEDEELVANVEAAPTETGMEVSDLEVTEVQTNVTLEPTGASIEVPDDSKERKVMASAVIVEPSEEDKVSIPDEPTEGEMEPSNLAAGYVKIAVELAELTEAVVDLPATEPAGTEMEVADFAVNENASIPVEPTGTGMELSSFAVEEVKDTIDNVAEPKEPEIKKQDFETGEVKTSVVTVEPSEMEEEEVKPSIPVEPNEVERVPSNVEIAEPKDSVEVADPTEAALKVTDFEAGEDQAGVVMVEPLEMETQEDKLSILAEPTKTEMESFRIAVDEVKNSINDAEPNEPGIKEQYFEAGEVKTSVFTVESPEMEVEEDKSSKLVEPNKVELEPSNLAVGEVWDLVDVAESTETAVQEQNFKAGEVKTSVVSLEPSEIEEEEEKPSLPVEPNEVEPSNLVVGEVWDLVDVPESTETLVQKQDFEESELKASFVTIEMGMDEDKPSIPAEATETEMEASSFATDEASNTFSFANLTRSGTIDLFAMELTNDTLNDLYYDITSNPMEKVQKFEQETADDRDDTVSQHDEPQDSTLEERETLSQSFQSDHDTLDTTNWSFTEPDDTATESFKTSDETDTFDTDNSQLSEGEDSGLVNSFQTACIGSDLEHQDEAISLEDDSEELITPRPDESSAVALAGLDDILSQVCSEEEETPVRFEEPSHSQACVEVEVIKKEEPLYVDDKPKAVEDPEVSSWLETFLTAVRKKEEKIRQTSIKEKTLDDIKEVDEDLTQMEAGSSTKPDTKNSTDKIGDQRPPAVEDKFLSEKNSGPAWLQDILKSLREKEEETEGDTTVIHKGEGLFSKIETLSEQLHLEQSNIEKLKETEAEKAWIRLQIEECVEDATSHSEGELKDEEASSNQYTDESSEEKCEGTGIDQFSEGLSTYAASLDADQRSKYRPHHLAVASTREEVPSTPAEPEPVVEESLTWWQQTLASAHTVKDSKPPEVPEESTPPPTVEETELKRRFEEEFSENQTLEDKAEAFRLLETVLAATRKEEIESLLIEPEVKEVVHELLEEDTKSTSSSDSSYHEEPVDPEAKPPLTLRQVLDSFNAIQETVALRTQQRSQRIKELIDNPLTKEFCAQSADDINRQVEEMKMDQRKRINDMIDKVYAQRDKYNDTLEVVNGRLMVVKRGTGALEEVPPPPKYNSCGVSTDQSGEPSSKYVSCGVSTSQMQGTSKYSSCGSSTDQTNNAPSKYSSCGSSTDQTNNAPSKYSSCGSSTDQTNNAPSNYSSCGVSSQTEDTHKNDSESDDYGTALSDEAANDDDDGDIEQHASDTKIKRIPYLFARCSTTSQSSSNISQEGDEEDNPHFECNNEQQYASLRKVQQLHKDIDEALFIKASKWMEDGVEIPPMQPPVLEKRKGKEEEMLLKNFLGPTIENNEIPPELYNELQSFMDFDEEALEDIASIFDTPDEGE